MARNETTAPIADPIPAPELQATSLRLDPALWRELKVRAAMHDTTLSALVDRAVRQFLDTI